MVATCNPMADAALSYATAGVAVLPVDRDKRPMGGMSWTDATTDAARIIAWWSRWPDANVGAACTGSLVVLDVDGPQGRRLLAVLEALHGPLPKTYTVSTGREDGGVHLHFDTAQRPATGWRRGGLELKAKGFVVMPPSVHHTGRVYRANDLPRADAPGWLLSLPRPRPARTAGPPEVVGPGRLRTIARAAVEGELAKLDAHGATAGTGRHTKLYASACALGRHVAAGGLADAEARTALSQGVAMLGLPNDRETAWQIDHGLAVGASEPYALREHR